MRIVDTLAMYAEGLKGQGMQDSTVASYGATLRQVALWLDPDDAEVTDLCAPLIGQYQGALAARTLKPRTIGLHLTVIRSYCRWCQAQGLRADDPTLGLVWPRVPRNRPRALTAQQLRQLHDALALEPRYADPKTTRNYWRNRRGIYILLYAGLRIKELSQLAWDHIDMERGVLTVVDGKGGKDRVVPLARPLWDELARVPLDERRGAVCGRKNGQHVQEKSLAHLFERWLPARGLDISAHQLRHSCATLMRQYGADLRDIQEVLGHESLETTQVYLGVDPEDLRDAINALPPLAELTRRRRA